MESQKVDFESTDITFHSRDFRPTQSFERAQVKARVKDSKVVRVYGIPRLVIDTETKLIYLGFQFSDDITKRIQGGELVMKRDTPWIVDEETKKKISETNYGKTGDILEARLKKCLENFDPEKKL